MAKFLNPKRFSKENLNSKTFDRFVKFLGPVQNFYGIKTVEYLNIRMFIKDNKRSFKMVNDYKHKYYDQINIFVKSILRTYSDAIFTNVIK